MKSLLIVLSFVVASSFSTNPLHSVKKFDEFYTVELVSTTAVGSNYEWVWKVSNPDPGNGLNGTLQDLSHWGLILPSCVTQADIVSAAYSKDNTNWNALSSTIAVDPSQTCYTMPVLKFNVGFTDDHCMYYKLVVNKAFTPATMPALFKSGKNTGCFVTDIPAFGCGTSDGGGDVIR